MSTLLLRLAGPMQAWGTDSRFDVRFTGREPSKSGVIGLLCAALGKPRHELPDDGFPSLASLAALQMGVRVDREGSVGMDYQTAGGSHRKGDRYGVINASGSALSTVQSRRYYLADADFLAALVGDEGLMRQLDAALAQPRWQMFLGRKAFAPGVPVRLPDAGPGSPWWDMSLHQALASYPWSSGELRGAAPERLRVVVDAEQTNATVEARHDVPVDFAARRFGVRYVTTSFVARPGGAG